MKEINELINELAAQISYTNEYRSFKAAEEKISSDELEKIKRYKCLKIKLINTFSAEMENTANELYRELSINKDIKEYMLCEKVLSGMVADIYDKIGKRLNIV